MEENTFFYNGKLYRRTIVVNGEFNSCVLCCFSLIKVSNTIACTKITQFLMSSENINIERCDKLPPRVQQYFTEIPPIETLLKEVKNEG